MALSDFKLIILKGHLTNQLTSSLRWQFEGLGGKHLAGNLLRSAAVHQAVLSPSLLQSINFGHFVYLKRKKNFTYICKKMLEIKVKRIKRNVLYLY